MVIYNVAFHKFIVFFSNLMYSYKKGGFVMALPYNDIYITILNCLHCRWNDTSWSYLDRPRPDFGFMIMVKGHIDYIFEDSTISLHEKDFIFLPKGSKYNTNMHIEEGEVETMLINFDVMGNENFALDTFLVLHDGTDMLYTIFCRMFDEFGSFPKRKLLAKSDMYLLYHTVLTMQNSSNTEHRLIRDAKLMLVGSENLSVDEIAKKLAISSSGLRKKFKDAEGLSPVEFRIKNKIDEAKLLLVSTDLPITEIAENCGFYDTAYFYKAFCKNVGVTPKEYRSSARISI